MKRHVAAAAIFFGMVGSLQIGCSSSGVGDPCTPESEFDVGGGGANVTDLSVDLNSTQCDTRVCLQHYFQGRVTCPFGNGQATGQATPGAQCLPVDANQYPGLYTLDGTVSGTLCCPVVGGVMDDAGQVQQTPINKPVEAQCSGRTVSDSVYCTCRCDVPSTVDKSTVNLCTCPSDFVCLPLFTNPALPLGKQGSYCVRKSQSSLTADASEQTITGACGADKTRP